MALLNLALLLAPLAASAFAFAPIVDEAYLEVISSRMTCKDGGGGIGQWLVAPVPSSANRVQAVYDPPGFLVSAQNGVWAVSLPVARNESTPGMQSNNASLWNYPAVWTPLAGVTGRILDLCVTRC